MYLIHDHLSVLSPPMSAPSSVTAPLPKENKLVQYFPCTHWSIVKLLLASPLWEGELFSACTPPEDINYAEPCSCWQEIEGQLSHVHAHATASTTMSDLVRGPTRSAQPMNIHMSLRGRPRPWACAWSLLTKVTDSNMDPGHIRTTNPLIPLSLCVGREPPHNLTWLHIPLLRYQTFNV